MRLSPNFTSDEFSCKCCKKNGVDLRLVTALQELRNLVNREIVITSGYRCPKHNREVGGTENSYHVKGLAADVQIPGLPSEEIIKNALSIVSFRGFGKDKTFVHLDIRPTMQSYFWMYTKDGRKSMTEKEVILATVI